MMFLAKLFLMIVAMFSTIHSMNVPPLKLSNPEVKTLEKALNTELHGGSPTFYTSRTPQELQEVISVSNKVAQDNGLMQYYAKAYQVTIPELLQLIKKIILKATQRALLKKTKPAKKVKQPKPGKKKKQAKVPKIAQATLISPQFKLLSEFIEQDFEGNDDFFLNAPRLYLENIVKNALEVLQSYKLLNQFSIEVGTNKVESAEDLRAAIENARWALNENAIEHQPAAIQLQSQIPGEQKTLQPAAPAVNRAKHVILSDYLNTDQPESFDEKAIEKIAREITQDDTELAAFAREFGVEKSDALALLKEWKLEEPKNAPLLQPILPDISVQKIPATVQQIPVVVEQPEEEIQANQLYIGLDVKEINARGEPILWQNTINKLIPQLGGAEFLPNDYFHMTIAWIESKNPISPEIIAKVERALTHATEILKIVFPQGIREIGLLDGAMMLGKSAVVFRVAESIELKKLQEIILKFLAFEKITGVRYSTFAKDTPLHVTLGKIKYGKYVPDLKTIVANLSAPEGLRASRGQSSIINTFRLTYSQAGLAWQERMSYRF